MKKIEEMWEKMKKAYAELGERYYLYPFLDFLQISHTESSNNQLINGANNETSSNGFGSNDDFNPSFDTSKNEELDLELTVISNVFFHPCLYNVNSESYKGVNETKKAFAEITKIVKMKYKNKKITG